MVAVSLGLGSCWIQIRNRKYKGKKTSEKYIQEILGLPSQIKVESIISIGHPGETRKPVTKSELRYAKVRRNSYSESYF
jgi:nitroreductase